MGCMRFARLTDIPQSVRKPQPLKPYMVLSVSAYGSTEGKNKPNNILNIFHQ